MVWYGVASHNVAGDEVVARLLLVFALLGALTGTVTPPGTVAAQTDITFVFDDEVAPADEWLVREGIRYARSYAAEHLGRVTERNFEVDARPVQEFPNAGYVAGNAIYISTENSVWLESSPLHRLKIVIHEYFHLIQFEAVPDSRPVPRWLLEGSAELFAYQAVAALGLVDFAAVVDYWILGMFHDPATAGVPLEAMEQPEPAIACCLYSVSPLAVIELLKAGGWPSFLHYLDIFSGMPPEDSFSESFDRSLSDFYAEFASSRQSMTTVGADRTALWLPWFSVEGVADVWSLSAWSPVERGGQAYLSGWTAPGIACSLTFTSASGNELLTQVTHANSDGQVFWLWSVRTRLSEGAARADVTCGANVASIPIELI